MIKQNLIKIVLAYKNEKAPSSGKFVEILEPSRVNEWSDIQGLMRMVNGRIFICD